MPQAAYRSDHVEREGTLAREDSLTLEADPSSSIRLARVSDLEQQIATELDAILRGEPREDRLRELSEALFRRHDTDCIGDVMDRLGALDPAQADARREFLEKSWMTIDAIEGDEQWR